ncbi:tumor necrosis factor alpha-induced protein 2a isoform X2 [Esox lucius]|uniref:tumor necrosis factor alpha-induced protein 2a isoform X2 n=1 Tax=Esox lucius TaxID=8010 RepID=UPI0009733FF0|nr:tumor necrosis factor alpha-induced protein 2a isoform X2 [Esox lucius]
MNTADETQGALGQDRPEAEMPKASGGRSKNILRKLDKFWKKSVFLEHSKSAQTTNILESNPPPTVVFDFQEYLKQNLLVEACQQLLLREEELFGRETVAEDESGGASKEEANDSLQIDNEALLLQLRMAVDATFSSTLDGKHLKTLKSAVDAIVLQEQQDRYWESLPKDHRMLAPVWRPNECWVNHTVILKGLVASRMREAAEDTVSSVNDLSTPVKREVFRMGKCVKEDILKVAVDVKGCYPAEYNVCNLYMRLYHQEFSARLTKLAHSELDLKDCSYIIFWVNHLYPSEILQHSGFEGHVNCTSLGTLLSEEDLTRLEEQYLQAVEDKVRTWVAKALSKEENGWLSGKRPELIDGYYCCPLAIDVIQAVYDATREARTILSSESKAQRILSQLDGFLISFKKSLKEYVKARRENTQDAMKANLFSIEQFGDFFMNDQTIPEEVKASCTSTLADLRDCGYRYFTGPIHEELRVHYRQLWTPGWFTGGQRSLDDLMETLDRCIQQLTGLNPICKKKLLDWLHTEVTVEYVRRMMKRKMRLKDKEQQEAAADVLQADSRTLANYFNGEGSKTSWLKDVLPRLAEVVRLQDPGIIHLEIVTLARDYPDISWKHITDLLYLKVNLSRDDIRSIKKGFRENLPAITSSNANPAFFSRVQAGKTWQN